MCAFRDELLKRDPRGCYELTYLGPDVNGIQRFESFFFAPSWWTATGDHFTPVLTVDGTGVETVIGGCLLTSVTKSANNNLFPFACMYCSSETGPLVKQFGDHLRRLLPKQVDAISDSGTGLVKGMDDAGFRYNGGCYYHIVHKNAQLKVSKHTRLLPVHPRSLLYKYHVSPKSDCCIHCI